MATNDVRNVMLRALFEPDYHNLLSTDPEKALQGYALTDQEKSALIKPTSELYRFLEPSNQPRLLTDPPPPPPPPTTVTVIIVVAITVFVTAVAAGAPPAGADIERFRPLLNAIRSASGAERFDLVRTLVNELTRGA